MFELKNYYKENKEVVTMTLLFLIFFYNIYYFFLCVTFMFSYEFIISLQLEIFIDLHVLPEEKRKNRISFKLTNRKSLEEVSLVNDVMSKDFVSSCGATTASTSERPPNTPDNEFEEEDDELLTQSIVFTTDGAVRKTTNIF